MERVGFTLLYANDTVQDTAPASFEELAAVRFLNTLLPTVQGEMSGREIHHR